MKISRRAVFGGLGIAAIVAALWAIGPTAQSTYAGQVGSAQTSDVVRTAGSGRAGMTGIDLGTPLSNSELTAQSDLIAIGRAVETSASWADGGRNLFTLVRIDVAETLKGDTSSSIIVALPGGVDANRAIPIAMTYPGAPRISRDEEVFLFLVHADDEVAGTYAVTGFAQGKFSIEPAATGAGLRLLVADKRVRVGDTRVSLSTFKEEIRSYLKQ